MPIGVLSKEGRKQVNSPIQVTRSSMPPFEEYIEEIRPLWESRWLTNMGSKHQELEKALEQYLQIPHVSLFANGHLALEAVLAAFRFPEGSEVITTPFTFASTTHAIVRSGLTPVFCDIDPVTWTMDPEKISELVTERTAAILPVHVYGTLCDVDAIQRTADQYGLKVIYDAAHAFGVTRDGVSAATFGDVSVFSFHATKVFHTVEGGAVCFQDSALRQRLESLKNFGFHNAEAVEAGGNAKLSEFHAAMGMCNLRHLEEEIARRGMVSKRYRELLGNVKGIRLRVGQRGVRPNYAYFPVVFDGYSYTREEVFERLKAQSINARKYFYPLTSSFPCYRDLSVAKSLETAVHIAEQVLCLPLYAGLALTEVEKICETIL